MLPTNRRLPFGTVARAMRKHHGMTQRAAASALGITSVHMCNIERGHTQPSLDLLGQWREVFGMLTKTLDDGRVLMATPQTAIQWEQAAPIVGEATEEAADAEGGDS